MEHRKPLNKILEGNLSQIRGDIAKGLEMQDFEICAMEMDISQSALAKILRVNPRTLSRRKRLSLTESERLLRVYMVFRKAVDVLEGEDRARRWFSTPKRALANCTPLEHCELDLGIKEVENLLGRIDHGVFS